MNVLLAIISRQICGARVRDNLTGEVWDVKAKVSLFFKSERNDVCSDSLVLVAVAFSFFRVLSTLLDPSQTH